MLKSYPFTFYNHNNTVFLDVKTKLAGILKTPVAMILLYGSNDNELQDSDPVAPYYIGKTIYAKVGGISGGMKSVATRKKTVDAQTKQYAKEQARLGKEQAQMEKEKQRQRDESLQEEQKKQDIDEKDCERAI